MKLLIFVLIVFVANIVSVSSAKVSCHTCANCQTITDGAKDEADCDACSTIIDNKQRKVTRGCAKAAGDCKEGTAGDIVTKCCTGEKCNKDEVKLPELPAATKFSCYECTGCANPFQKDTGKKLTNCEACKTTTTKADKKINKACIATAADCKPTTDDTTVIECCTTDLCNAGISHSIKKSVLVGLLTLAIGAICY